MERLTVRTGVFEDGKYGTRVGLVCGANIQDALDRLAVYEDTGLEPTEYTAMANAMKQAEYTSEDLTETPSVNRIAKEYLEICDGNCAGDSTVGIQPCPFYMFPDVGEKGGCELKEFSKSNNFRSWYSIDELDGMEGQKVLVKRLGGDEMPEEATVRKDGDCRTDSGVNCWHELYGHTWVAYHLPQD